MESFDPDDHRWVGYTPAQPEPVAKPEQLPPQQIHPWFAAVSLFVALLLLCCLGLGSAVVFAFEVVLLIPFGWLLYLKRVVPQLQPDPWAVVSGILCLAAVTVGTHYFARLFRSGWSWKRTGQLVGLVVLMFLGGLACTGLLQQTLWLIRSPEPWTEDLYRKDRELRRFEKIGSSIG